MNNNKSVEDGKKPVPTVSTILPTGELVELLYDPRNRRTALAVGSGDKVRIEESLEFGGTRLIPWNAKNNLIRHETLILPERPEGFGTVTELLAEIDAYISRYVDLTKEHRGVVAGYVLLTWVYDAFNELPYLRFRGDLGSGKTRALVVAGGLCYRGFFASGASTVSPIFHTLDTFRGTLILDEADFRFSDEKAELSKILNNGNVQGFPVLRTMMTPQKEFDPRAFLVYGPKVIAMRGHFDDRALESRFITIEMEVGTRSRHIPINLPDEQKEKARSLRNKLLAYRFANRLTAEVDKSLVDETLTDRANQVALPLLSLVEDKATHAAIKAILQETHADTLADRAASPAGHLIALLLELASQDGVKSISIADLTAAFTECHGNEYDRPITTRYIGSLLRRMLEIRPYQHHGIYKVGLNRRWLANRAKHFGVESSPAPASGDEGEVGDVNSGIGEQEPRDPQAGEFA
jgi:hypothetical protein